MYVSREELTENLGRLDTANLRGMLRAGGLTKDAKEFILEELARRGSIGDVSNEVEPIEQGCSSVEATPLAQGRSFAKIAFTLYIVFVGICALITIIDPPWQTPAQGTWEGMLGGIATFGAGLPWTYLLASMAVYSASPMKFVALSWSCVVLNFVLFALYFRRTQ